ncbi:MAG: glutamyl-tRNA reductase [Armatimonadota bacterium]
MHLVVIGLSHKTAPVEIRERFSISEEQLPDALRELKSRDCVSECIILSTCNRTEICAYTSVKEDDAVITQWMGDYCGVSPDAFSSHLYIRSGHKAVEHLFRVATSIDSLVLGEAQILGQIKTAYGFATQAGSTGPVLNSLVQQAITVGKRVRTETEIGRGAFSIGSVAVQLAKSMFDQLKGLTLLVVGAGKMGELATTHIISSGATNVLVANRTYERAEALAERFGGRPIRFENLSAALESADIVITSTGAREPVITVPMVSSVMRARRGRPVFFIDIAVPRDIEAGVDAIDNVFVYDIDDLERLVESDAKERQVEVSRVEAIIAEEVGEFMTRFRTFDAIPVITALRDKFEGIRQQELEKLKGRLGHLSPQDMEVIEVTTRSIVNKICHTPMIQIKDHASSENASVKLDAICDLFGICPIDNNKAQEKEPDES